MHYLTQTTKRILTNQTENNEQPERKWAKEIVCLQKGKLKIHNKHEKQSTSKVHRETENKILPPPFLPVLVADLLQTQWALAGWLSWLERRPETPRLQVRSPVRAHTGSNQWMHM